MRAGSTTRPLSITIGYQSDKSHCAAGPCSRGIDQRRGRGQGEGQGRKMDLPRHSLAASERDSFRVGWGKGALARSSSVASI